MMSIPSESPLPSSDGVESTHDTVPVVEGAPSVAVPSPPKVAYILGVLGAVLCLYHANVHFCMCGHLAHEETPLAGFIVDEAWVTAWGVMMVLVARYKRRTNWFLYFWTFVTGTLSFGLGPLTLVPMALMMWFLFSLDAVKRRKLKPA